MNLYCFLPAKCCVTWSPHDCSCNVQWCYFSLQRAEILLIFFIQRHFLNKSPEHHQYLKFYALSFSSIRTCKFAIFMHLFWTPFFLGYSQGLKSVFIPILGFTIFHLFPVFLCHSRSVQWNELGNELSFSGIVFNHCCSSKPCGPVNVEQRTAECICSCQNRQNFNKSFRLKINLFFLICICVIRHN